MYRVLLYTGINISTVHRNLKVITIRIPERF